MSIEIECGVRLATTVCPACGVTFAMPEHMRSSRLQDGKNFFCPGGHSIVFRDGENDKLRKQVAKLTSDIDQQRAATREARDKAEAAERRVTAQKAVVTRMKNRAAKGHCPCCDKLFPDLESHMKDAHPDYEATPDTQ